MIRPICSSFLLLCIVSAPASAEPKKTDKPAGPVPERIEFKTSDGITLVGSYFAPRDASAEKKAPVAILIHIWPLDRHSWKPLVPHLLDAGFAVVAYDIRGNGESVPASHPDLNKRYKARDPKFFADAWRDADAAVKWVGEKKNVDATRIAMIGASIGSSIALDYGTRNEHVKAVVCLSPGTNYFGLDSIAHVKKLAKTPVLLCAPEAEREDSELLAKQGGHVTLDIRPGGFEQHGTHMFAKSYGAKLAARITEFVVNGVESGASTSKKK